MQQLVEKVPTDTFPRKIPELCCPPVRAYLTEEGLLAPVGLPGRFDMFRVPCPKERNGSEHRCHMWRSESRFECSCDFNGDYWDYAAACRNVNPADAYKIVLQRMEIEDVTKIRHPIARQPWHEKKAAPLIQLPTWVPPIRATPNECGHIPDWEHPAGRGPVPEYIKSSDAEWQEKRVANASRFEKSRELLESAVGDCLTHISRSERHTLFMYFRLGETLDRLENVCKHECLSEHPGKKWDAFLSSLANRSERYIRQARRIFRSVEFIWQLEPFQDVKQFLDAVRNASSPHTQIAVYKDGQTRHSMTLQQKFEFNKIPSATVTVELKDGKLASVLKHLDPTVPSHEHRDAAALALTMGDSLMAACIRNEENCQALQTLVDAIASVCCMKGSRATQFLERMAAGLQELAYTTDVPEWVNHLPKAEEVAKHPTTEPFDGDPAL